MSAKLTALTALTTPSNSDILYIVADTGGTPLSRKITFANLVAGLQPLDATLTALANLTIAANSLTIGTGVDTFSQTVFSANSFPARGSTGGLEAKTITDFGLSLVDDANAATARTTLGLVAAGAGDIWVEKAGDTMTGPLVIDPPSGTTAGILAIDVPSSSTTTYAFKISRGGADILSLRDDGYFLSQQDLSFGAEFGITGNSNGARITFGTGGVSNGNTTITAASSGTVKDINIVLSNLMNVSRADAVTNTVTVIQTLQHTSSGTPAAGFGAGLNFQLESTTTNDQNAAALDGIWDEATHASRKGAFVLSAYDVATKREVIKGGVNGSAATLGFLGATPVARQAHIADPSGGAIQDAEARTAINAILIVLENFGLVATS